MLHSEGLGRGIGIEDADVAHPEIHKSSSTAFVALQHQGGFGLVGPVFGDAQTAELTEQVFFGQVGLVPKGRQSPGIVPVAHLADEFFAGQKVHKSKIVVLLEGRHLLHLFRVLGKLVVQPVSRSFSLGLQVVVLAGYAHDKLA